VRRDELRVAPERTAVDFGGYAAHVVAVDVARLDGKVAFITGAGGAIAGAIARRFATEGAAVMCVDINADAAARTVGSIASAGGRAIAQRCDVSNAADVKAAIDAAAEAFSRIDVLVSTAANSEPLGTTLELDEAKWNETPAVNLTGAFLVCKYGIPRLIEAGGAACRFGCHISRTTSRRSLQACIASLPLQSSWMSNTYLKSDHFNGGGSFCKLESLGAWLPAVELKLGLFAG